MQSLIDALASAPAPYSGRSTRHGRWRRARLIENLQMESIKLRPKEWNYPARMPAGRGDNLSDQALEEATRRLHADGGEGVAGLSYADSLERAVELLNPVVPGKGCDYFYRWSGRVAPLSDRLWHVCSLFSIKYSFTGAASPWKKAAFDWFSSSSPETLPVQPDNGAFRLGSPGGTFWLTDRSPLDLLAKKGISVGSADAAWIVLRELALPGFETQGRRLKAMGLVVVEFPADALRDCGASAQAWKPTAVDALGFKGYCFLPGRPDDVHGLTWPLRRCLRHHENRDGMSEYLHPSISVPAFVDGRRAAHLLGFLDAEAERAWHSFTSV